VFLVKYGPMVDMTILAMWQRLSLAYLLKDIQVEAYAEQLYQSLYKRKYLYEDQDGESSFLKNEEQEVLFDECKKHTDLIKVLVVCALIMEITRRLSLNDKLTLKHFCTEVVRERISDLEL
jgi:hypothetical protein